MKLKLVLVLFLSAVFSAYAQDPAEVKSRMNQIKRDTLCLYGEATMDTKEESVALAKEFLTVAVKQWINDLCDKSQLKGVDCVDIVASCDTLTVMRGSMVRALAYVHTFDLYKDEFRPDEYTPAPVMDTLVMISPDSTIVSDTGLAVYAGPSDSFDEETADPLGGFPQEIYNMLTHDLLNAKSISEVKELVRNETYADILSSGEVGFSTDPKAIVDGMLVIYDDKDGSIAAVLSPKSPKRLNVGTDLYDSTVNYSGKKAYWICYK